MPIRTVIDLVKKNMLVSCLIPALAIPVLGQQSAGSTPWVDVRMYGARTFASSDFGEMTTASTFKGSPSITVSSASDFLKGDGIVISRAGPETTQRTPGAPTVTTLGVTGSRTISYKCVGADSMEGLTAAGPAGSTTNAPTVFGPRPVVIRSISRLNDVVTVDFSTAINVTANEHIIIANVTRATTSFNGIFLIASAPSPNEITFAQAGRDESGAVSSTSIGRLVNGFVIKSITRSGNVITVKTDVNHNFVVGTPQNPTVVQIDGVQPFDFDGWYTIASVPAANEFTVNTGYVVSSVETGSPYIGSTSNGSFNWNTMGVISWEANQVSCPVPTGSTWFYYVYANYGLGTYSLIGATLPGSGLFKDWGPFLETGYVPPPAAQVPSEAPSTAQNEEFVGTIASIQGTTFTLNQTVPAAVSSQPVYHDDSIAIQTAATVANDDEGGVLYMPGPSLAGGNYQYYLWNAPFSLHNGRGFGLQMALGAGLRGDDTMNENVPQFKIFNFGSNYGQPQFGSDLYAQVVGYGNPIIWNGSVNWPMKAQGIYVAPSGNGQVGIYSLGTYSRFEDSFFDAGSNSASIPLILGPSGFTVHLHHVTVGGYPSLATLYGGSTLIPDGQPFFGPPIPCVDVQSMPNSGAPAMIMDGINAGYGRGIMYDASQGTDAAVFGLEFDNVQTFQAPWTPFLMFYGNNSISRTLVSSITMDSHWFSVVGNFGCSGCINTMLDDLLPSTTIQLVTGDPLRALSIDGEYVGTVVGQNFDVTRNSAVGQINYGQSSFGSLNFTYLAEQQERRPLIFPQSVNYPLAWEQTVTGLSASASDRGTFPPGVHSVCVTPVGWNGGESTLGCTSVTVNGAQGIEVSWNATPDVQGYNVYVDGERENASIVTATAATYSRLNNYAGPPALPGSGLPLIDQNQVATPMVRSAKINQIAPNNFAGSCSMPRATACTTKVTATFNSPPLCFATDTATSGMVAAVCSDRGGIVTVTAASPNSHAFNFFLVGNPN